jgi:site-specific DNA-methyltransferase (adenine-specific)
MEKLGNITLYNADCINVMKQYPARHFDIAIVDPPYGINAPNMSLGSGGGLLKRESTARKLKRKRFDKGSGKLKNRILNKMGCDWDICPPTPEYFAELFRISKNQIIWGGNYFNLPPTRGIVVWDKEQTFENFSQVEIAWTSYDIPAKLFRYSNAGFRNKNKIEKIHPTQKPVALYAWLLNRFACAGCKIIDTHGGSMTHAIACHDLGYDLTIIEIDKEYYDDAKKRLQLHQRQLKIF